MRSKQSSKGKCRFPETKYKEEYMKGAYNKILKIYVFQLIIEGIYGSFWVQPSRWFGDLCSLVYERVRKM